jgi:hypothetical protein
VPSLTWGSGFSGGSIPSSTPFGTTIATLSDAASYAILSTTTPVAVSGTNLITATTTPGAYTFYLEGFTADGTPGVVPADNVTFH